MFFLLSVPFFAAALFSSTGVHAQLSFPRTPSPAASVTQTIGISTVTVNYSRPSVKGREIWGKLVPYGLTVQGGLGPGNPAPWRAGANENTTIRFSHDAKVEGQPVKAGEYGLFFVVNADNTADLILSKDYQSWGSFFYSDKNDLMHAKIQLRDNPFTEMLTYDFMNNTKTSSELVLNWEKKQFPVKIEFAVDDIVMASAGAQLQGSTGFDWHAFLNAAGYALQNKVNQEQAVSWVDQSIAAHKSFTALNLKSNLLKALGKTDEAAKVLDNDAIAIADKNELNLYGYQLLNNKEYDKAIEMLALNAKRYPDDPNCFDSLGEAYATKGDKKNAIINFKKSLSMNPPPAVKANSEKFMKQLGAM